MEPVWPARQGDRSSALDRRARSPCSVRSGSIVAANDRVWCRPQGRGGLCPLTAWCCSDPLLPPLAPLPPSGMRGPGSCSTEDAHSRLHRLPSLSLPQGDIPDTPRRLRARDRWSVGEGPSQACKGTRRSLLPAPAAGSHGGLLKQRNVPEDRGGGGAPRPRARSPSRLLGRRPPAPGTGSSSCLRR